MENFNTIKTERYLNRKIILVIVTLGLIVSCSPYKKLLHTEGSQYNAIENAIVDYYYTNKKEIKKYKVFQIFDQTDSLYYKIDILPQHNIYSVLQNDSIGSHPTYFPTNYKFYKNKLFVWNDIDKPLSQEMIDVLDKHEILDSIRLKYELGIYTGFNVGEDPDPPSINVDETLKGVNYVICKRNISKYGKIKTSGYIPPDSDKQPKIDCE